MMSKTINRTPETSAIIAALEKNNVSFLMGCEVCDKIIHPSNTCEHHKNGYCALFRLQSAKDMIEIKNKSK